MQLFIITVNNSNAIIVIARFQSIIYSKGIHTMRIAINHQEFTKKSLLVLKPKSTFPHEHKRPKLRLLHDHGPASFFLWSLRLWTQLHPFWQVLFTNHLSFSLSVILFIFIWARELSSGPTSIHSACNYLCNAFIAQAIDQALCKHTLGLFILNKLGSTLLKCFLIAPFFCL